MVLLYCDSSERGISVEILIQLFFVVLGILLQVGFLIVLPSYLAVKTVKILFPHLLEDSNFQFLSRGLWHISALSFVIVISLSLSLLHFGVDIVLEIPTWAPWAPEDLHYMYHHIPFTVPIAVFIAKIMSALYFGRRYQNKGCE